MWLSSSGPKLPVAVVEAPAARLPSDCAAVPEVTSRHVTPVRPWAPVLLAVTV